MQSVPRKRLPLLGGVVVGLVALLMLTATSDCEKWSATGPLPWPTPTVPADPHGVWEEYTGWTWQELEDYVGEIAAGMSGAGAAGVPAEGDVLPNGARVICSNPTTGVYIIELGPLPPPPAPLETDRAVTLAEAAGQEARPTATPAPNDGDGDLVPPDQEEDEDGDNAVTC